LIDANVDFFEYLGSETNLHLSSGSNRFSAKFNKKISSDLSAIKVMFNIGKGHFFDPDSQDII